MHESNGNGSPSQKPLTKLQSEWLNGVIATAKATLDGRIDFVGALIRLTHDANEIARNRCDLDGLIATGFCPMNNPD